MKRIAYALWGVLIPLFFFSALSAEPALPLPAPGFPVSITDEAGRTVTVPKKPERIVSLSPAATEILFRIGAGTQVAARTSLCNYPPEAAAVPSVGGFDGKTFSLEKILSFRPDMVYASAGMHDHLTAPLERYGIAVYVSRASTVESVLREMLEAGTITGNRAQAESAVEVLELQLAAVAERVSRFQGERRRVYWEVWDSPYMSAGAGSFLNDLITLAGGVNIFADLPQQYPVVSGESILRRDPEVILLPDDAPSGGETGGFTAGFTDRPGWLHITALRNGAVRRIPGDIVSRPGPRLGMAVEAVAAAVYPELFGGEAPTGVPKRVPKGAPL